MGPMGLLQKVTYTRKQTKCVLKKGPSKKDKGSSYNHFLTYYFSGDICSFFCGISYLVTSQSSSTCQGAIPLELEVPSWWLNHPSEKNISQTGNLPQIGVNMKNI